MVQQYTVSDFVTLEKKRKLTAVSSPAQQANIYLWLRAQGFGQTVVNGKTIFFRKQGDRLVPATMIAMRYAFLEFLETHDFTAWPEGITRHDLMEWFYATQPPARNHLFHECLFCELSPAEISSLTAAETAAETVRSEESATILPLVQ